MPIPRPEMPEDASGRPGSRDWTVGGSARVFAVMRLLLASDTARLIVVGNACIRFGRTGAEDGLPTL